MVRCGVGDREVVETLRARGLRLGGEQSGHLVDLARSTTGDGLLTAATIAAAIARAERPASELLAGFVRFPQLIENVRVRSKPDLETLPESRERQGTSRNAWVARGASSFATAAPSRSPASCSRAPRRRSSARSPPSSPTPSAPRSAPPDPRGAAAQPQQGQKQELSVKGLLSKHPLLEGGAGDTGSAQPSA